MVARILNVRSGGTVVLVGMGPPEVKVPLINACVREVDIRGIFRYTNCYPTVIHPVKRESSNGSCQAISLVAKGLVDVKPLITHRFALKESIKAFETARTGEGGAIKVMIKCAQ